MRSKTVLETKQETLNNAHAYIFFMLTEQALWVLAGWDATWCDVCVNHQDFENIRSNLYLCRSGCTWTQNFHVTFNKSFNFHQMLQTTFQYICEKLYKVFIFIYFFIYFIFWLVFFFFLDKMEIFTIGVNYVWMPKVYYESALSMLVECLSTLRHHLHIHPSLMKGYNREWRLACCFSSRCLHSDGWINDTK